ncbi:gamma-glutamyltransferase [Kwoniella shivajii]|uniref:Glutathione hydrolase n=1 Tax=Kwoniella shivajii TaxID=564305 RepID=A0ABZ1CRY8_9TREE|nr:gamma-glutamyltransferase [Kwoniella shivajii]
MSKTPVLSGAVTSESTIASSIGTLILSKGGNAVDAIIATVLAINTLCPYHSDIGGGGFAIIRTEKGDYKSLNFRHKAPAAVDSEFYRDPHVSTMIGGAAVAVPGEVKGLEELHNKYGRLSWDVLFEPSIDLAEDGFEVTQELHNFITASCSPPGSTSQSTSWMASDPEYSSLFKEGQVISLGSIWKRPEYASTLRKIAKEGSKAFHEGDIAESIIEVIQERGGLMTLDDLKGYQVEWNQPLSIQYRDYTLWAPPAPASGAIWLSAMGILSQFEPESEGSVEDLHRLTEALRLAYGQRTALGDPNYVPGLEEKQLSWLTPSAIKERSKLITDKTHAPDYYKPSKVEIVNDHGTSNITVADSDGMVISITTTVGLSWGSHIIVPKYGFVLNDSMDDFSIQGRPNGTGYEPQPANFVYGGKRPLSSSCPYIIEKSNGTPYLAGGAAGGSTIISANVQIARNVLDYGLSAKESLKSNRLHNQILPNVSLLERSSTIQGVTIDGFSQHQCKGLEEKGHKIEWIEMNRSVPVALKFNDDGSWEAEADPRRHDTGGSVYTSPKIEV